MRERKAAMKAGNVPFAQSISFLRLDQSPCPPREALPKKAKAIFTFTLLQASVLKFNTTLFRLMIRLVITIQSSNINR